MAWLVGDGFDFYNLAADVTLPGTVWTTGSLNPRLSTTTRFGAGVAALFQFATDMWQSISFANSTTVYLNVAFVTTTAPTAGNAIAHSINLLDAGTKQCGLSFIQDGSICLTNNAGTILTGTRTPANTFLQNQWIHIQAKIVIDPAAGTFEVRANGSTTPIIPVASGLNTRITANSFCNSLQLLASSVAILQPICDDFYAFNDQGAQPNTWQGDVRAVQQMPASDFSKQWTPNSGTTNFSRVNELREDGDTTYVIDATVNDVDQYGITALATTPLNIIAVQSKMFARMDDAGPHTVKSRLTSAGTVSDSPNLSLTTNYQWLQQMYVTDPHTLGTWTAANLNAVTIGPYNVL